MNKISKNTEVSLIQILKLLLKNTEIIKKITIPFIIVGFFISILSPVKYKSSIIFSPQISDNQSASTFSSIASIAGLNLNSENQNVYIKY